MQRSMIPVFFLALLGGAALAVHQRGEARPDPEERRMSTIARTSTQVPPLDAAAAKTIRTATFALG